VSWNTGALTLGKTRAAFLGEGRRRMIERSGRSLAGMRAGLTEQSTRKHRPWGQRSQRLRAVPPGAPIFACLVLSSTV